jgi:hypothetical protein
MKTSNQKEKSGNFDSLYNGVILVLFKNVTDSRATNNRYETLDALKSGFAIYSLKFASLFSFRKRSTAEDHNLNSVYKINKIPTDNTLRNILDGIEPDKIRKGFHALFKRIKKIGILDSFRYWRKHVVVSVDGVEHFCSKSIHCKHCMQRKHRDGSISFYHSMLSAAIVHPDKSEVFILDNEPIVKQDGATKNDCERNAAQRLMNHLQKLHSKDFMVFVFDALYACAPVVKRLIEISRWEFIIAITPDGNKSLFRQFEARDKRGQVKWHSTEDKKGKHRYGYTNNLALNDSNTDIRVNMLYYEWTNTKGETKKFTWITRIKLTKANVYKVMRMARSRWKIENEAFNTLKNQDYNFEHNFGHGKEHLCTIFAYLMMLAFYVDQIQQSSCQYFKKILRELKTRLKFWESIRAVFKILPRMNMMQIFFCIADMYQIRLE